MAHDEHPNPNPHDDPAASRVLLTGILGSFIVVAIAIGVAALVFDTQQRLTEQRVYDAPSEQVELLRSQQTAQLGSYRIVDREKGIWGIPIRRAMELTARELAVQTPAPAGAKP